MKYVGIAFIAIFVIQVGLCIFLGYKKGMKKAIIDLVGNVAAVLLALGFTKLLSIVLAPTIASIADKIVAGFLTDPIITEILQTAGVQSVYQVISELLLAIVLFPILYLVFYFLVKIPKKIITKKFFSSTKEDAPAEEVESTEEVATEAVQPVAKSRDKKDWILGMVFCALSGLLSSAVFPMTIFGPVNSVYQTAKAHDSFQTLPAVITETVDSVAASPIVKANAIVTTPLRFVLLGSSLGEVIEIEDLAFYGYDFVNAADTDAQIVALDGIRDRFNNSKVLAPVVADVLSIAAREWTSGRNFLGVRLPVVTGMTKTIFDSLLKTVANLEKERANEDINSFIALFRLVLANDLVNINIAGNNTTGNGNANTNKPAKDTTEAILDFASDPEQLTELYTIMLKNRDISELVPSLMAGGMDATLKDMGVTLPANIELNADLSGLSDEEIAKEAELTSNVISNALKFSEENKSFRLDDCSKEDAAAFMNIIVDIEQSKVAASLLPTIQTGIVEGLSNGFPDMASDIKKAKSLSDIAKLFR